MNQTIQAAPLAPPEQRPGMMLAHLLGLLFGIVGALIYWLVTKDDNHKPFVQDQAREVLNFEINLLLVYVVCGLLSVFLIGFVLAPLVWVVALVLRIIGVVKANAGELYRYPFITRFIDSSGQPQGRVL